MVAWRLARALTALQTDVNDRYPDRPIDHDGTIGDPRHQAEQSDHNPNPPHPGVVTAWDITTAPFTVTLAETLRRMGRNGDRRVKYVIYRARITSAVHGWQWAPYTGSSDHYDHIHLSVSDSEPEFDRTDPWNVFAQEDELTADDLSKIQAMISKAVDDAVKVLHGDHVVMLHGDNAGHVNSIDSIAKQVGVPQT